MLTHTHTHPGNIQGMCNTGRLHISDAHCFVELAIDSKPHMCLAYLEILY